MVLHAQVLIRLESSTVVAPSSATGTPTATPAMTTGSSKTSKGVTVAIAIVVPVAAIIIIALVWFLVRRRRQNSENMLEARQHALVKERGRTESTDSSPHIVPFPLSASMPSSSSPQSTSRYTQSTDLPTGSTFSKSNAPMDPVDAQILPSPELLLASQRPVGETDPEDIPVLIQRLNTALSRLPPRGVPLSDDEEAPPQYHER